MTTTKKQKAWFVGGLVALTVAGLTMALVRPAPPAEAPNQERPEDAEESSEAPCPAGSLPDEGVCVPAPHKPRTAGTPADTVGTPADTVGTPADTAGTPDNPGDATPLTQ